MRPSSPGALTGFYRRLIVFFLSTASLWAVFLALYSAFPNIRPGAQLIYDNKIEHIVRRGEVLPEGVTNRVVVFGNSQILSGFIPEQFDGGSAHSVRSINLGLPDASSATVGFLDTLIERGQTPTHVLFSVPWDRDFGTDRGLFNPLGNDLTLLEQLFPFRRLVHNLLNFLSRAGRHGGVAAYYRTSVAQVDSMLAQRGYYFIFSDALYADHQLPADFSLSSDTPSIARARRPFAFEGPAFEHLMRLADQHDMTLLVIPDYVRPSQYLPHPLSEAATDLLHVNDRLSVIEAPYVTLLNEHFSDPYHLNAAGAAAYTRYLRSIFNANDLWR